MMKKLSFIKKMNPQKRIVYLMLFIIVLFHFAVIPLWMWNLGL